VGWLSEPGTAMASVVAVNVWRGFPFFGISFLAGMKSIPAELYEAAAVDGASALQRFLADKATRIGQPLRLRVQLRSFDAVCRLVECNVGIGIVPETTARRVMGTMAIIPVALTDPWAVRELTICIRSFDELPPYARQLVEHLRTPA